MDHVFLLFTRRVLVILKFISRVPTLAVFATSALNLPLCPFYNFKLGRLNRGKFLNDSALLHSTVVYSHFTVCSQPSVCVP